VTVAGAARFRGIWGPSRGILGRMKLWIAAVLLATGCYRSAAPTEPPPEPRPGTGEPQPAAPAHALRPAAPAPMTIASAMEKMNEFTDEMCACTDKACAEAVGVSMERWAKEMGETEGRELAAKMTDDDKKEVAAIAERIGKCMMTLMAPGTPSSPPTP
jgi:hypothetical protein